MKKSDLLHGFILCFAGGAMNAYSYTMRGGVIAAAQTANFLRMSLSISEGDWSSVFRYMVPIIGFITAVCMTKWIRESFCGSDDSKWHLGVLTAEIIVFFLLGFSTDDTPDGVINLMISFCAAMQYCTFRSFGKMPRMPRYFVPVICVHWQTMYMKGSYIMKKKAGIKPLAISSCFLVLLLG